RPERAPVDIGEVEHADRARLLPQRGLPTVLGLPAAQAGCRPLGEMDALGHALPAGALQEIRRMLRGHLDGILSWTKHRVSNGAVEGMNNKIKSISHRSFGFRSAENFIAAIYHCCARLPLPLER